MELSLKELTKVIKGKIISGNPKSIIKSISIDSRTLNKGDFFIPLLGEKCDGHQFINEALSKGAIGFLTSMDENRLNFKREIYLNKIIILVENTQEALEEMAKYVRKISRYEVVAITGSIGKTVTKEIITSVLKQKFKVECSPENYNTEIGVPLTILSYNDDIQILILELAMRGLNQITRLAKICKPKIGVMTLINNTHIELLGSVENIVKAKSELIKAIPKDGVTILCRDDKWYTLFSSISNSEVVNYGLSNDSQVSAKDITLDEMAKPRFKLCFKDREVDISLPITGDQYVLNSLAAAAVGISYEMDLNQIKKGLESVKPFKMRMQIEEGKRNILLINDSYNANPTSMKAAIKVLSYLKQKRKRRSVAILGDMLELGKFSGISHINIGKFIVRQNVDLLLTRGENAKIISQTALSNGMSKDQVHQFSSNDEIKENILNLIKPKDIVLVKASRAMAFDDIADFLTVHN